jgi:hypothetical protein
MAGPKDQPSSNILLTVRRRSLTLYGFSTNPLASPCMTSLTGPWAEYPLDETLVHEFNFIIG